MRGSKIGYESDGLELLTLLTREGGTKEIFHIWLCSPVIIVLRIFHFLVSFFPWFLSFPVSVLDQFIAAWYFIVLSLEIQFVFWLCCPAPDQPDSLTLFYRSLDRCSHLKLCYFHMGESNVFVGGVPSCSCSFMVGCTTGRILFWNWLWSEVLLYVVVWRNAKLAWEVVEWKLRMFFWTWFICPQCSFGRDHQFELDSLLDTLISVEYLSLIWISLLPYLSFNVQ